MALSREVFDAALVEAAVSAGCQFLPQTQARLGPADNDSRGVFLRQKDGEIPARARVVLAADGLGSHFLAESKRCDGGRIRKSWIGVGALARVGPAFYEAGCIFMAYGPGAYLGIVRLEDGRLDLAAAVDPKALRGGASPPGIFEALLHDAGFPPIGNLSKLTWRGTVALTQEPTRQAAERVLAIGDAAGYVEPFTGEGIGWALATALEVIPPALAGVKRWTPKLADGWETRLARAQKHQQQTCRFMKAILHRERMARVFIQGVSWLPFLARPVIWRLNRPLPRPSRFQL
jgi:flavin-dependent dehydrogenase